MSVTSIEPKQLDDHKICMDAETEISCLAGLDMQDSKTWLEFHPSRYLLLRIRKKSRRDGSWFKRLDTKQRRFLDLVIYVVMDKVRSLLLCKALMPIIAKLISGMGGIQAVIGDIRYGMINEGRHLAERISRIAHSWGNRSAIFWAKNKDFIQYLTVVEKNKPR